MNKEAHEDWQDYRRDVGEDPLILKGPPEQGYLFELISKGTRF